MTDDRDDLAERVAALEDAVRELRADEHADAEPARDEPSSTPRDTSDTADGVTVRAATAILEANARALELLRSALDGPPARETADIDGIGDRTGSASPSTLARADRALDHLLAEMEAGSLPRDADARAIVEEARGLRDEIDDRLGDAAGDRADTRNRGDARDRGDVATDDADEAGVEIDVEDELASIKDALDRDATGTRDTGSDLDGEPDDEHDDGDANG